MEKFKVVDAFTQTCIEKESGEVLILKRRCVKKEEEEAVGRGC